MKCEAKPSNLAERSVVICLLTDKGDNTEPRKFARVGSKRIVFICSSIFHFQNLYKLIISTFEWKTKILNNRGFQQV